jgi:outer membrane protein OmpA-like peptidoglycan-associated protein
LNQKRQVIEEKGPGAPGYLVTFTALVTLLMLFFITLLSFATIQDEGIGGKGRYTESRESFFRAIRTLGMGMFHVKEQGADFGNVKPKYFITTPDKEFEGRTIDAKEESIRQTFQELSRSMKTMRSKIVAEKSNFAVTNIRFLASGTILNEQAKRFLTEFCVDLQQGARFQGLKLYVLGLARDKATEKEQWIASAKRAQAVADFLQETLPSDNKWPVYSWGAGPGGDWVGQDSLVSSGSQILIGVLRGKD